VRDFAASAGRLRVLSFGAKLLYTAFAVSAIIGLVVSWQLYGAAIGEGGDKVYYAGAEVAPKKPAADPAPAAEGDGPALELPEEATAPRAMTEQISERKLLEVTHFHLFSVPVYVLILAHLWLLARMPAWLHTAGIVASVVTSGLHLAAPWIVRGRPGLSVLMPISGILMLVAMGIIAIVPAIDMWLPRPARRAADAGDRDTPND
jgi:uncharacterized membrane protein